jgi:hypothetical protein
MNHFLSSPLDNPDLIERTCSTCHDNLVAEIEALEANVIEKTTAVGENLEALHHAITAAMDSGKYTEDDMKKKVSKTGGLVSLLGTDNMLEIKKRIEDGDQWAKLVYENFAYQLAKYIGSYACVLEGKVDAIVMTGGVSNDKDFIANINKYAGWIAPLIVYGGDFIRCTLAFVRANAPPCSGIEFVSQTATPPPFSPTPPVNVLASL